MCRTYAEVENVSETARRCGRSLKTVTRHLRAAGVTIKPRRLEIDEEKIVKLYRDDRLSLRVIAARTMLSYGTVHRVVSEARVMRKRGSESRGVHCGAPAAGGVRMPPPSPMESAVSGGPADSVPSAL